MPVEYETVELVDANLTPNRIGIVEVSGTLYSVSDCCGHMPVFAGDDEWYCGNCKSTMRLVTVISSMLPRHLSLLDTISEDAIASWVSRWIGVEKRYVQVEK